MRNPLRKLGYSLAATLIGGLLLLFGTQAFERSGETPTSLALVIAGVIGSAFGLITMLFAARAAFGQARLLAGNGLIASWHVTAAEWDRFRAIDAQRSGMAPEMVNDLWIRRETPHEGVEIRCGERSAIIDGSFHALSPTGNPTVTQVQWTASVPACLEFTLLYLRSGGEGADIARPLMLRVPVPPHAREAGARVLDHHARQIREARAGTAGSWPRMRAMLLLALLIFTGGFIAAALLSQ